MEKAKSSLFFSLYAFTLALLLMGSDVHGCSDSLRHKGSPARKLFVFGDSFVDTGNIGKVGGNIGRSWLYPYGTTFPHGPTGRFSDGRVLTDFVASFMGIKSPLPYKYRRFAPKLHPYGMNFAVGGSGIYDLGNQQRNLSAQIDTFEERINEGLFSECDLKSSVALVAISGNDYSYYLAQGGAFKGIYNLMDGIISGLKSGLKRIGDLGVGKVVVTNLFPLGCTPYRTRPSNYTSCIGTDYVGVMSHNMDLKQALEELGRATNQSAFFSLDLNTAFSSLIDPVDVEGPRKFKHALRPCCDGKTEDAICGQRDEQGLKQYTLCCNPDDYFFWDDVHPTQAGWTAVFEQLKPSLREILV